MNPIDIIGTNLLANSHDDQTIKLASRVLTRPYALLPGDHVFEPTLYNKKCPAPWRPCFATNFNNFWTNIIGTILLTKVLTRFYYSHMWPYYKKCPAFWWPCFKGAFSHFG
ncbi:hypothetical protein DPMN_005837 [Dreissena polymorpha]|uniref:Uncharacterized protein n=1 Tax=Dreissena polymorpha TaxID=45954 RepID=A0A9D4RWV8_DREPO|nr:hypothetical protein DPMN_005837 [Dreissena polymorpha]